MEDQIIKITALLDNVTLDINECEVEMMRMENKDARLLDLEKRLNQLWRDAYHIKVDLRKEVIA